MVPVAASRRSLSVMSRGEGSQTEGPHSSFSVSVARLLDRIDYRRADTAEAREAIFRLRYQAYMRDGTIIANASGTFSDHYDDTDNVYLFGLYIDGELASSIRIHVATREHPYFPTLEVFPEYLQPELDAGKVIVDPTRFVADERLSRIHRALPYATLRLCGMCARYFKADELLAAVRAEHQAFYRRIFQHRMVCAPRPYPLLAKPIGLMTIDYPAVAEQVHRRYPFFRSTLFERRMLFERTPVPTTPVSASLVSASLVSDKSGSCQRRTTSGCRTTSPLSWNATPRGSRVRVTLTGDNPALDADRGRNCEIPKRRPRSVQKDLAPAETLASRREARLRLLKSRFARVVNDARHAAHSSRCGRELAWNARMRRSLPASSIFDDTRDVSRDLKSFL